MNLRLDIYHHFPKSETGTPAALAQILTKLTTMAHTIDEVLAAAKASKTAVDGAVAIIEQLRTTIKEKTNLSAEDQAKVDEIFDTVKDDAAALVAAANVGTPDETPADVKAVKEFEALPEVPLVEE